MVWHSLLEEVTKWVWTLKSDDAGLSWHVAIQSYEKRHWCQFYAISRVTTRVMIDLIGKKFCRHQTIQ